VTTATTIATATAAVVVVTSTSSSFCPTTHVTTTTVTESFYLQPCIENVASGEGVARTLKKNENNNGVALPG
jgi:hypothetical protein